MAVTPAMAGMPSRVHRGEAQSILTEAGPIHKMKPLEIFRAGTFTPMEGGRVSFSAADLDAAAAAYDPALHEAPMVVGHPATDDPAYGWVGALEATAGRLVAAPRQVDPAFAELVEAGRYKKISASFYAPGSAHNPKPGAYYLKHVGFLGAVPPSVKGLKPVAFAGGDDGVVTVEFGEAERTVGFSISRMAEVARRVRDYIVGREGIEAAEKIIPNYLVDGLIGDAARIEVEARRDFPRSFAETDLSRLLDKAIDELVDDNTSRAQIVERMASAAGIEAGTVNQILDGSIAVPPDNRLKGFSRVLGLSFEAMKKALPKGETTDMSEKSKSELDAAELAQREQALKAQEITFAEKQKKDRRADNERFLAPLIEAGKLAPGLKPMLLDFMDRLDPTDVVTFGEGATAEKTTALDAFKSLLGKSGAVVDFSERAAGEETGETASFAAPDGATVDAERLDLHNRALAYARAHPNTAYMDAIRAVSGR